MLTVLITKVHLTVTVMLGILVMDLIVLVSKSLVVFVSKILQLSGNY